MVRTEAGEWVAAADRRPVTAGRVEKMSKSKRNTIDPTTIIDGYGADTARLFMLSDSPPDRDLEWTDAGVDGAWRYLNRLWRLVAERLLGLPAGMVLTVSSARGRVLKRLVHKTITQVTIELERLHFNKGVALVRELSNAVEAVRTRDCWRSSAGARDLGGTLSSGRADDAPSGRGALAGLGHERLLVETPGPSRPAWTVADTVIVAVQVNGKRRAELQLARRSGGGGGGTGAGRSGRAPRHGGQAAAACRGGTGQDRECRRLTPARAGSCWWRCWRSAGCNLRPIYAAPETNKVLPDLAAIEVGDLPGRRGQYLRDYLIDEFNPQGVSVPPAYSSISDAAGINALAIQLDDTPPG